MGKGKLLHVGVVSVSVLALAACEDGAGLTFGGKKAGYCSDVTRVSPVGGAFSDRQRAVYDVVLDAQSAAVEVCAPGVSFRDVHDLASLRIADGLVGLGLLRGAPNDIVAAGAHAAFFTHGLGHALGLGHAGNYNGGANFHQHATFDMDSWQLSVMSYFAQDENPNVRGSRAAVIMPMEADILALDLGSTPAIAQRAARADDIWEEVFATVMMGDDRAVAGVWIAGDRRLG